ncbi:hypothetical protein NKI31_12265 [Mesorhizobium sp. M0659]|uniref:hypothetical protein n=1 Tax=Mesorhizobium sp. M0659 TaxID=2956980 RepID=UPI0033381455
MSVQIQICVACGHAHFPDMLLCASCAGASFSHACVEGGKLIAATDICYRVGGRTGDAKLLGLLETDPKTLVLARMEIKARPGQWLRLSLVGDAVWACV